MNVYSNTGAKTLALTKSRGYKKQRKQAKLASSYRLKIDDAHENTIL